MTYDADVIGVGFGPGNLALAVSMEERRTPLTSVFLEARTGPSWQPGMLLDGADIQNSPLRDLVTPVNPRSRWTFVNYLHETGRFFEYLNIGSTFPLRKEYARYLKWVADGLGAHVRYGSVVRSLRLANDTEHIVLTLEDGAVLRAPQVVVAPGRTPRVPPLLRRHLGARVIHFTDYLPAVERLSADARVAVVGASQSAVELMLDLRRRFPRGRHHAVLRGFGFRLKDTSPFMEEVYFPEHVDYHHRASEESRAALDQDLRYTNYSAADGDVILELYASLYEDRLDGVQRTVIHRCTEVVGCSERAGATVLHLQERHTGDRKDVDVDLVVLATGFLDLGPDDGDRYELLPPMLAGLRAQVAVSPGGRALIARDYRLEWSSPGIGAKVYLNGLCESSHGMGDAGSFSLLALRAGDLESALRAAARPDEHLQDEVVACP